MNDSEIKKTFAKNLRHYMNIYNINQTKVSEIAKVSKQSVSNWLNAKLLPRMGAVELLADYFGILKSDLLEDKSNEDERIYSQLNIPFEKLPLYGDLCCGDGMFNDDNIIEYITVPIDGLNPNFEYFCQRAKGDSMTGAGIFEGDILIFEKTPVIDDGCIGTFCVDENIATCKKIKKGKDFIQLLPMNPNYDPIIITLDNYNFRVVGKLKKVVRDLY